MNIADLPDAHLRIFDRPPVPPPDAVSDLYLIGICGTGMGSLAGLLHAAGYAVRGSDHAVYPPMSLRLAEAGIPVYEGYDPARLDPPPDLVIVGNACTPTHPEASYAREHGLRQQSFPEALAHFFLHDRRSLVVAGTHGKTTTTGLLVHMLRAAGLDPGFLVGGVMQEDRRSYALGAGPHFVVEGDEYDSAYFDKGPKFMHYRPLHGIVTSMELDHMDIYPDWASYRSAFEGFARLIPPEGVLALCGDAPPVDDLARHTPGRVRRFGLTGDGLDVTAGDLQAHPDGLRFTLLVDGWAYPGGHLPLHGRHNLLNALAAATLALEAGLTPTDTLNALTGFRGMMRRLEVRGRINGVTVLDDFAHHPTAVQATLEATRAGYPDARLIAVFEPRSNSSRRKRFEAAYAEALALADRVFLSAPPLRHNDDVENLLDADRVVHRVREAHTPASAFPNASALLPVLLDELTAGDVVLIMSNGGFDGLHDRLLQALTTQSARSS